MHESWSGNDRYFPKPAQTLAAMDKGVMVTPPKGLEIGYVPICAHQQVVGEKLPEFPNADRKAK